MLQPLFMEQFYSAPAADTVVQQLLPSPEAAPLPEPPDPKTCKQECVILNSAVNIFLAFDKDLSFVALKVLTATKPFLKWNCAGLYAGNRLELFVSGRKPK